MFKGRKKRAMPVLTLAGLAVLAAAGAFHGCGVAYDTEIKPDSITVTPAKASIITNSTQQYTATAKYADNTTLDVTNSVAWSSSNASAATISTSGGLATAGGSGGTTTVTATGAGGVSGSTSLTVLNLPLQSISVTPATATVPPNYTKQFTAMGLYSNGTTTVQQDISKQAIWSSSDTTKATIDAKGLATGLASGTVTITASKDTKSGTATLTVDPNAKTISSLAVMPTSAIVKPGKTQKFGAVATYSDSTTADVSTDPGTAWSSSDTTVATVDNTGLATVKQTALWGSTCTITATNSQKTGSGAIKVPSTPQ